MARGSLTTDNRENKVKTYPTCSLVISTKMVTKQSLHRQTENPLRKTTFVKIKGGIIIFFFKWDVQPVLLFWLCTRNKVGREREPADTISDTSAGQLKARPGTECHSPQRQTTEAEKMGEKEVERLYSRPHTHTYVRTHTVTHTSRETLCAFFFGFYLFFCFVFFLSVCRLNIL